MKNTWMRAGVALTAVSALGLGMSGTANADDQDKPEPTRGSIVTEPGWGVNGAEGSSVPEVNASRIYIQPDDSDTPKETYCIDIKTKLNGDAPYQESTWDDSSVENLELVQWILHNGYPNADGATLAKEAGVDAKALGDKIDQAAYTATQTAVWTYTDKFKLNEKDATEQGSDVDAAVATMSKYLVDNAEEMPEPSQDVNIDGPDVINTSEKSGPYNVTTPGDEAALKIEGGKIVDKNDKELKSVPNGGEFWIIPEDDADKIVVKGISQVSQPTGSVFMALDDENAPLKDDPSALSETKSQRLILAASMEGEVGTEVTFETKTDDTLPVTGMSLTTSLLSGAGLLLLGAIALVLFKRRRTAATWGDAA